MAGRPNNAAAIEAHISGLRSAKAKFQALPEIVRNAMNDANEETVRAIQIRARRQLDASPSVQTRSLWNAVQVTVNRSNGTARVGIASGSTTIMQSTNFAAGRIQSKAVKVKGVIIAGAGGSALTSKGAKLIRPSRYAHLVEWGSSKMAAEPFMTPAQEAERRPYVERCKAAKSTIVAELQSVTASEVTIGGGLI